MTRIFPQVQKSIIPPECDAETLACFVLWCQSAGFFFFKAPQTIFSFYRWVGGWMDFWIDCQLHSQCQKKLEKMYSKNGLECFLPQKISNSTISVFFFMTNISALYHSMTNISALYFSMKKKHFSTISLSGKYFSPIFFYEKTFQSNIG